MKTTIYSLLFFVSFVLASSCAGIRGMRVQVKRPAEITLNQEILKLGMFNRSLPTEKARLEGTLTGELPKQDAELSAQCIRGLNATLQTSSRFSVIQCEGALPSADPKSLSFGNVLEWETVDSICAKYGLDGLLVLEYFDTDFSVLNPGATIGATATTILNGVQNASVEVKGTAKATAGFRIYYPKTRNVLYENSFQHSRVWTQTSTNPIEAIAKLIKKNEALTEVSFETGQEFAFRIVPLYFWENRDMYKGKKGLMAIGERQALAKDWEGALITWTNAYEESNKSKIRAKAAFNVALSSEVLGNLEEALKWAQKAYIEGGKDPALNYSSILDRRVREQARLQEQENSK